MMEHLWVQDAPRPGLLPPTEIHRGADPLRISRRPRNVNGARRGLTGSGAPCSSPGGASHFTLCRRSMPYPIRGTGGVAALVGGIALPTPMVGTLSGGGVCKTSGAYVAPPPPLPLPLPPPPRLRRRPPRRRRRRLRCGCPSPDASGAGVCSACGFGGPSGAGAAFA